MLSSDQVCESGPKVCQGRTADSLDIGGPKSGTNHDLATRWGRDPESASKRVPILRHSLVEQQVQAALMEDRPPILHHSLLEHQGQDALMEEKLPRLPQNTTIMTHLNHNAFVVMQAPLPAPSSPLSNIGLLELRIF